MDWTRTTFSVYIPVFVITMDIFSILKQPQADEYETWHREKTKRTSQRSPSLDLMSTFVLLSLGLLSNVQNAPVHLILYALFVNINTSYESWNIVCLINSFNYYLLRMYYYFKTELFKSAEMVTFYSNTLALLLLISP